jgi:hypothetical protein
MDPPAIWKESFAELKAIMGCWPRPLTRNKVVKKASKAALVLENNILLLISAASLSLSCVLPRPFSSHNATLLSQSKEIDWAQVKLQAFATWKVLGRI